ncbi:MAG: hypothetical protein JW860_09265 [Sedimentisphaerales bacterium]|nr:hypothetical protein [Sedimentisphaerales bacterium]
MNRKHISVLLCLILLIFAILFFYSNENLKIEVANKISPELHEKQVVINNKSTLQPEISQVYYIHNIPCKLTNVKQGGVRVTHPNMDRRLHLDDIKLDKQLTKNHLFDEWGVPDYIIGSGTEYLVYILEDNRCLWLQFEFVEPFSLNRSFVTTNFTDDNFLKDNISEEVSLEVQELLDKLNSWDKQELDVLEHPDKYPDHIVSGESKGWVGTQKDRLKELGFAVNWNEDHKIYELERKN